MAVRHHWLPAPGAIVAAATKTAAVAPLGPQSNPNYTPCVPNARDVDCAGGNGNGPAFVAGPIRVIGRDVYRLDGDGDGVGCEP